METKNFVITNKVGLHARPGALFVQTAAKFKADITIRNVTRNSKVVDAKSVLGVLGLQVRCNEEVEVSCEGEDAAAALQALTELIETRINEPEVSASQ